MSVPGAPALTPTSTVGVPITLPVESNCGSNEARLVVPAGNGVSWTTTCEQLKSAVSCEQISV